MLWRKGRRSDNVIDARGEGGAGGGGGMRIGGKGLSLGGVAIVVVVGLLMGQDPMQILGSLLGQMDSPAPATQQQAGGRAPAANDEQSEFVRSILGDTEDTWEQIFASGQAQYQQPKLVLFSNGVNSACGFASSATGPFYCPADRRVYLDLEFFREMEQRFSAAGDFAQAYVIAHEVGHHVQNLMGISAKINAARQRARAHGGRQRPVGTPGTAGGLLRRGLGQPCTAAAELAGAGRHRGSPERRQRHRRRSPATPGPRHGGAGFLHPWLLGATRALVQDRLRERLAGQLRYLQGPDALSLAASRALSARLASHSTDRPVPGLVGRSQPVEIDLTVADRLAHPRRQAQAPVHQYR